MLFFVVDSFRERTIAVGDGGLLKTLCRMEKEAEPFAVYLCCLLLLPFRGLLSRIVIWLYLDVQLAIVSFAIVVASL